MQRFSEILDHGLQSVPLTNLHRLIPPCSYPEQSIYMASWPRWPYIYFAPSLTVLHVSFAYFFYQRPLRTTLGIYVYVWFIIYNKIVRNIKHLWLLKVTGMYILICIFIQVCDLKSVMDRSYNIECFEKGRGNLATSHTVCSSQSACHSHTVNTTHAGKFMWVVGDI